MDHLEYDRLERLQLFVKHAISQEQLIGLDRVQLEEHFDYTARQMVLGLRATIWGKVAKSEVISYPEGLWDYVQAAVLRWLQRWPRTMPLWREAIQPRYKRVQIDGYTVCPKLKIRAEGDYMTVMSTDRREWSEVFRGLETLPNQ